MSKPILVLDVDALVKVKPGDVDDKYEINNALITQIKQRFKSGHDVDIILCIDIPFLVSDELDPSKKIPLTQDQLRDEHIAKITNIEKALGEDIKIAKVATPYDFVPGTELGYGYNNVYLRILDRQNVDDCKEELDELARMITTGSHKWFTQFSQLTDEEKQELEENNARTKMMLYTFSMLMSSKDESDYLIYLESDQETFEDVKKILGLQYKNNPVFTKLVPDFEENVERLNAEITKFYIEEVQGLESNELVETLQKIINSKNKELTGKKLLYLAQFLTAMEKYLQYYSKSDHSGLESTLEGLRDYLTKPVSVTTVIDAARTILAHPQKNSELESLVNPFARLLHLAVIGNEEKYDEKHQAPVLIDLFKETIKIEYWGDPRYKEHLLKIDEQLESIRKRDANVTELLKVYTALMSFLEDPRDEDNMTELTTTASELSQHKEQYWRPLGGYLCNFVLQLNSVSLREKMTDEQVADRIVQCKDALKSFKSKMPKLAPYIDALIRDADRINKPEEQRDLLEALQATLDYLEFPSDSNRQFNFYMNIEKAKGKASTGWRVLGGSLAAFGVVVTVLTIVALATPAAAVGVGTLLLFKTMLASHFGVALGTASASAVAGTGTIWYGREKGMYKSMHKFEEALHDPKVVPPSPAGP